GGLNNAKLVSVSTYQDLVPAFQGLLARLDNNLPDFYRAVDRIASLPPAERLAALNGNLQVAESKRPPSGARN
ncbi:MAG: aminopeptidase, partial [Desulfuromonadales bacterium]|nr:aminopeptidase [Desulfuromonadales bacterium]